MARRQDRKEDGTVVGTRKWCKIYNFFTRMLNVRSRLEFQAICPVTKTMNEGKPVNYAFIKYVCFVDVFFSTVVYC
jgi:hypothetical protein